MAIRGKQRPVKLPISTHRRTSGLQSWKETCHRRCAKLGVPSVRLNDRVMLSVVRFTVLWLAAWCQVVAVTAMPFVTLVPDQGPPGIVPICHASGADDQRPPTHLPMADHDC